MGCPSGNCGKNATKIAGKRNKPKQQSSTSTTTSSPFQSSAVKTRSVTIIKNGKTVQR